MGIIETVKKGFGIATRNLGLVTVLLVFNLIWNLASMPFIGPGGTAKPEFTGALVVFTLLFILASIFIQGGSLALIRDYIKSGKIRLGDLLSFGLKYYLRLFGLGLLIMLIIAIVGLVAALIVVATAPLNNTAVTIVAAIIAIIIGGIGLYYILLLIMAPYTIVCEDIGIIESMKRSIGVVRRSIGPVLLLLIVLILISVGLGFLVGFLTGLVTIALPTTAGQVIIGIVNSIFNGYLGVVMMGSFMVFYLALIEKEKTSAEKVF